MDVLKPRRLRKGEVIGLVCPASAPASRERIEGGVRYLEGLGYRVEMGAHVDARHGDFAGTDAQRLSDLNAMLRDPRVRAVFAVRGGYGCGRLLAGVDYAAVRRDPKIVVGYSDLTALQLALFRRTGLVTFSGPMPGVEFWQCPDPFTEAHFWRQLTSIRPVGLLPQPPGCAVRIRRSGRGEGRLMGGCLSILMTALGTPYLPRLDGAVLVLEDIHEEPYRIDRMLVQLRHAGVLSRLAGLVLGQFTDCGPRDPGRPDLPLAAVLDEVLGDVACPAIEDFGYGHVPVKVTLPLGLHARLDAGRGRLTVLESAVV